MCVCVCVCVSMVLHANVTDNILGLWCLQQLSQHLPRMKKSIALLKVISTSIATAKTDEPRPHYYYENAPTIINKIQWNLSTEDTLGKT